MANESPVAALAVLWEAGRLVLSEPETFPVERVVSFARVAVSRYLAPTT